MRTRTSHVLWTVALGLLVGFAAYRGFPWLSLLVPGAALLWYGIVAPRPARTIAMRKSGRSGLH